MNRLRSELKQLLAGLGTPRPASVRRDGTGEALLATDLPTLLPAEDRERAAAALRAAGWTVSDGAGWWLLDRTLTPADMPPAEKTAEADCCLRLLRLHGGGPLPSGMPRALWKAADTDGAHLQTLLRTWHGLFAVSLRKHEPLPDGLIPFLRPYGMKENETDPEGEDQR